MGLAIADSTSKLVAESIRFEEYDRSGWAQLAEYSGSCFSGLVA